MPTVAYFTPAWPSSIAASGIASYVDRMAKGVQNTRWKAVVVAGRLSANVDPDSVPAYEVTKPALHERMIRRLLRRPYDAAGIVARSFVRTVRKHQVDLIEIEESFGWAAEISRRVSIPVVVRLHGPWCITGTASRVPDDLIFRERVRCEGLGIAAAAAVTAPSQNALRLTREYYGQPLTNAQVIPNPVSSPDAASRQAAIPEMNGRVVLYVGRFERLKGGDLAVRAFAELATRNKDCHFVFIGPDKGLDQSEGSRVSLTEFSNRYFPEAIRNRFHYLGQQPPAVVNAWRSRADVIIVTSRYETFGLVVVEAMQAAKPIIATAVGGIPEILTHEQTGLLVKPECVPSLVEAIQRVLNDPALASQLGKNACREVQQKFSLNAVVQQTLTFYDSVLQQWKSPRG